MKVLPTGLQGAYVVDIQKMEDERGFFARTFCTREFGREGLNTRLVQCSLSYSRVKYTLRGMHLQTDPHAETKLVRCTSGAIFDVIIDLRPSSATYLEHIAVLLSASNRKMLYVPEGFAHGFLTLEPDTEVFYQMTEFYSPEHSIGFRWNDPAFRIKWPAPARVISERDRNFADYDESILARPAGTA
jgi:dTDP-4-dehydrorhamnose 3,5-epimerase